jgi:hypothetical protein
MNSKVTCGLLTSNEQAEDGEPRSEKKAVLFARPGGPSRADPEAEKPLKDESKKQLDPEAALAAGRRDRKKDAQGFHPGHCPSWARTRTLLIQSQACCQLHQGAVFHFSHGAEGDRTPDLCSAIAALSQLSYSPKSRENYRPAPHPVNRTTTLLQHAVVT